MTPAPPSALGDAQILDNQPRQRTYATPSGEVGVPFGRYRLFDKIDSGETADIYRAVALGAQGFERIVAIKRIRPEAEVADISRVFADKARLSALLEHRNIVQVYDFGAVDGNHYIAMEYLRGKNLEQVLGSLRSSGERLSPALAVFVAREVALGLAHAHDYSDERGQRLGIVHRDVSPANIMLLQAGAVKLLDFGIARAINPTTITPARANFVRGKCHYLSPEQISGDPVNARSDIFALGVVLWEMLTGRQLFGGGSTFAVTSAVTSGRIPAPSTIVPALSADLDRVVLTALARQPSERYASADRMAADLEMVMRALPSRHGDLSSLLERVEMARPLSLAAPSGNAFARICGEMQPGPAQSSVAGGFLAVLSSVAICVLLIATLSPAPEAAQVTRAAGSPSHVVAPALPGAAARPVVAPIAVVPATRSPTETTAMIATTAPVADGAAHARAVRMHAKKVARGAAARARQKGSSGPRLARRVVESTGDPFGR
jgi:serine/threonine protein kinase